MMMWNSHTGLLSVQILPQPPALEGVIVSYVARNKGWDRSQYTIEPRGTNQFAVIHMSDTATAPGAGKSFELFLDPAKEKVTRELGFQ
jgi:hypothetical protein